MTTAIDELLLSAAEVEIQAAGKRADGDHRGLHRRPDDRARLGPVAIDLARHRRLGRAGRHPGRPRCLAEGHRRPRPGRRRRRPADGAGHDHALHGSGPPGHRTGQGRFSLPGFGRRRPHRLRARARPANRSRSTAGPSKRRPAGLRSCVRAYLREVSIVAIGADAEHVGRDCGQGKGADMSKRKPPHRPPSRSGPRPWRKPTASPRSARPAVAASATSRRGPSAKAGTRSAPSLKCCGRRARTRRRSTPAHEPATRTVLEAAILAHMGCDHLAEKHLGRRGRAAGPRPAGDEPRRPLPRGSADRRPGCAARPRGA